jgi:hypothetical protein
MKQTTVFSILLAVALAPPLSAQRKDNPPPPRPDAEQVGTQGILLSACPSDFRDGPYYENGLPYYGIPAWKIVEGFLSSPQDLDPWANVDVSSLRVLADGTDYTVCQRLTTILTNGARTAPPPEPWVYFTAGGFYFVSAWKNAQPLSNYATSYGHVMVFDSAFNLLGAYAS